MSSDPQCYLIWQVFSDLSKTPTAQFVIDDKPFDVRHISQTVDAEAAAQWTLTSNMNYFHPFHIHVNPFQVRTLLCHTTHTRNAAP